MCCMLIETYSDMKQYPLVCSNMQDSGDTAITFLVDQQMTEVRDAPDVIEEVEAAVEAALRMNFNRLLHMGRRSRASFLPRAI